MNKLLFLAMLNISIAYTVGEMEIFKPFRAYVKSRNAWLGELVSCGYCLGYWVAFGIIALYQVRLFESWLPPFDYLFTAFVIAWLSGVQWSIMKVLCRLYNYLTLLYDRTKEPEQPVWDLSKETLGEEIRRRRIAQKISQSKLGRFASCSASHISRIENGSVTPSEKMARELVEALTHFETRYI